MSERVEAVKRRELVHVPEGIGDQAADVITAFVGSWRFVLIHAVWFILWVALRFEPFPFGLLTLLVSLEAIFLSTFVMMSQNRQSSKDRKRDDQEASEVDLLYEINQHQVEILEAQNVMLEALKAKAEERRKSDDRTTGVQNSRPAAQHARTKRRTA